MTNDAKKRHGGFTIEWRTNCARAAADSPTVGIFDLISEWFAHSATLFGFTEV